MTAGKIVGKIAGLGISPIGWSNDDLRELGCDISLERCLDETRRAGYDGVELGHKFPREKEQLRAVLQKHELCLVSGWYSGELLVREIEEEKERIAEQLALFRELGAPVIVYGETARSIQALQEVPLASRVRLDEAQLKVYAKKLDALAQHCSDAGVPLVFHHHKGTVIETASEIDALMAATDREVVHLLFDTGHMLFAGDAPLPVLKRHARRVKHFHAKDLRASVLRGVDETRDSFLDCVERGIFTVPSDGMIDYAPLFAVLAEAEFRGWLVVEAEQDPAKAEPYAYALKGFEHLHALAKEHGLLGATPRETHGATHGDG